MNHQETTDRKSLRRLVVAAAIIGVSVLASLYFADKSATILLVSIAAVAVPIFAVIASWVGPGLREVANGETLLGEGARIAIVLLVVGFARMVFEDLSLREVAAFVGPLFAVMFALVAYADRDRRQGSDGIMDRLGGAAMRVHFAGYIAGLAAGIAVSAPLTDWRWTFAAYPLAFAAGKLTVDLLSPTPARLRLSTLSGALARMTVLSPLLWGLPWGIVYAAFHVATADAMVGSSTLTFGLRGSLVTILYVVGAVGLVLAAMTSLVYVQEVFARRTPAN